MSDPTRRGTPTRSESAEAEAEAELEGGEDCSMGAPSGLLAVVVASLLPGLFGGNVFPLFLPFMTSRLISLRAFPSGFFPSVAMMKANSRGADSATMVANKTIEILIV